MKREKNFKSYRWAIRKCI